MEGMSSWRLPRPVVGAKRIRRGSSVRLELEAQKTSRTQQNSSLTSLPLPLPLPLSYHISSPLLGPTAFHPLPSFPASAVPSSAVALREAHGGGPRQPNRRHIAFSPARICRRARRPYPPKPPPARRRCSSSSLSLLRRMGAPAGRVCAVGDLAAGDFLPLQPTAG